MKLAAVVASAARSRRTRLAVDAALIEAAKCDVEIDLIDLAEIKISIADGRPLSEYKDETASVVRRISEANCVILATPVYRGTYTGSFKNLLDHLPPESLEGKAVGLVATGATPHHYLMIDTQMRFVLAWFNAFLWPGSVYLTEKDTDSAESLNSGGAAERLKELADGIIHLAKCLPKDPPKPFSLARIAAQKAARKS